MLSKLQQEEREVFLAAGLKQIRGIPTAVFLEARAEFKPQWRALHAAERNARGDPETLRHLSDARRDLWDEVRSTTRARQDLAVKDFIAERKEQFKGLKENQRDERAELRALIEARDVGAPHDEKRLAELTGERPEIVSRDPAQQPRTANDNPRGLWQPTTANENQLDATQRRGLQGERAGKIARQQAALSRSQSMPNVQRSAMREVKDRTHRDRSPAEQTDVHLAKRIQEMQREDEQRRARDRDGHGRERVHSRHKDR